MLNYEAAVACAAGLLDAPLVLVGWSMGGLASMMASHRVPVDALVLLEASPTAEVGTDVREPSPMEPGTFDPEPVYGRFPPGMPVRRESSLARAERERGVSVPALPRRTLVVAGREYPELRGTRLAAYYGTGLLEFPDASHWDLVRDPAVREAVRDQLMRSMP
jgi:pimeloyl-ACP methyl ester carboxylesterase